jgi:hypothetical protein
MRSKALFLAAFAFAAPPTTGGAQSVSGRVVDAETRLPVAGAEVVLLDSAVAEVRRSETDSLGGFFFRVQVEGSYALRVSHLAYARYHSDPVPVGAAEAVTLEVRLGRTAIPLDPIVVTARSSTRLAEFHQRRITNAFGRFITEEEIERRSPVQTSDLLRVVPGISLSPVRVRGRTVNRVMLAGSFGRCEPAFYVDGVRLLAQSGSVDEVLIPATVAGVEIYSSSAGAPVMYADSRGCGSILFWTRTGEPDDRPFSWKRLAFGVGGVVVLILLAR